MALEGREWVCLLSERVGELLLALTYLGEQFLALISAEERTVVGHSFLGIFFCLLLLVTLLRCSLIRSLLFAQAIHPFVHSFACFSANVRRTFASLQSFPHAVPAVPEFGLGGLELLEGGCEVLQLLSELAFDLV